jgi:hypothetical protein
MIFQFNLIFTDATNDQKWEQIKLWRNTQLAISDWTQLPDAPVNKTEWATYRQALRDLPAQGGLADNATIPSAPSGD